MSQLKPCPFCGGEGVTVGPGSTFRWRVAECNSCGAATGEIRCQTSGTGTPEEWEAEAIKDAHAEWNRRAPQSSQPDTVAVPSNEELSALSLDSWERRYHKVRKEISLITWEEVYKRAYVEGLQAAQEGKK